MKINVNMLIWRNLQSYSIKIASSICLSLDSGAEREWLKLPSVCLVEFALELNPLQTQSMQEALHRIHTHDDSQCYIIEQAYADHNDYNVS